MPASIPEGAFGRPVAHIRAAVDICAAEWRRNEADNWVGGMVAAGWWLLGHIEHPPMEPDRKAAASVREIAGQILLSGRAIHSPGGPGTVQATWARGVYRMLSYARGHTDELPLMPTRRAAS